MSPSVRRRPLHQVGALLLALTAVALGPAAVASADDGPPAPADDVAALGGRVSQEGGAPVEFVSVTVIDAVTGAQAAWTSADEDGAYAVADLTPGSYLVRVDDAAHTFTFASRWYGGAYLQEEATLVTLDAGEVRDDVDVVLERAARACAGLFTPPMMSPQMQRCASAGGA